MEYGQLNCDGIIVPFASPRHGFPLIAGEVIKPVASLAYVDDANRYAAMPKATTTIKEFFAVLQGYCDLLADLLLVIKMGHIVKKCTIFLYNMLEDVIILEFSSITWSYDAHGPVKEYIATVSVHWDSQGKMLFIYYTT